MTEDAGTTLPGDTVGDTLTEDAGTTFPGDTAGDTLTADRDTSTLSGDTGSIPEGAGTTPLR
ncbi:hypothetical protein [Kamptonema formosum]|uniref:hypothetical protein n=1 Tax=Kamptonema formosum TaxID=331992 RepID=UPI0003449F47|nr:hypothetical protein [Oscillatoria sp. PCC 10802]